MKIRIIATGGTFDKEYNELNGKLFFRSTHIHEILNTGRCKLPLAVTELMMIDSLDMTDSHRRKILQECLACPEEHIVITHGTDTMEKTAKLLGPAITDKTVVLTGAMVPYKFGSSDGLFNLGSALSFSQALPSGVYIAMNGKVFHWNDVRKNKKIGEFEPAAKQKRAAVKPAGKTTRH
ncbi:MAG: asparaginase domain-containing protein [Elusimicrobiaceae bacterium]|nr:asparaginase domain-containing protein [Elusimicrobiaceae bacterium]